MFDYRYLYTMFLFIYLKDQTYFTKIIIKLFSKESIYV